MEKDHKMASHVIFMSSIIINVANTILTTIFDSITNCLLFMAVGFLFVNRLTNCNYTCNKIVTICAVYSPKNTVLSKLA